MEKIFQISPVKSIYFLTRSKNNRIKTFLLLMLCSLTINTFSQVNFETYTNSSIRNIDLVKGVSYSYSFTGEGNDRTIHINFSTSNSFDYSNIYIVYGFILNDGTKTVYSNYIRCAWVNSEEIRERFPSGTILSGYLVFYDKTINGSAGYNGYSSNEEELKYRPYVCERKTTIYNATLKIIKQLKLNVTDFSNYLRSITPSQNCK